MKRSIGSIILLLMFVRNSSVTQQITNIISSSDSANTQTNDQQGLLKTKYKKRLEKIDHFLNELTEKKEFSGSVLISRHGQLLLSKGYGFSDYLNLSNLNTFKTMYEIGSLTKEFTALIILKLHEFGLVNVNKDYLSKYLPGYPHSHQIRIEMLLQHISGIKDYTELPLFEEVYVGKTYALNELIKLFSHLPLDFKPGTKFEYSNSNYIVLGAVIKHVMSSASTLSKLGIEDKENAYRQLLHKYILNPVKMHHTIYENGHDDNYYKEDNYREKYQIAQGHETVIAVCDNETNKNTCNNTIKLIHCKYFDMSMAREAGGLLTSVKDFYLWLEALFNSPTSSSKHLIKPILLRQMMTPSLISRKNPYGWDGYGYGLIINDNGNVIEHTGEVYGFETCFKRLMKEQINIILFSNIFECPVGDYADYIQSILTTTEHGEFGAKRLRQRFNTTSKTKKRFKNKFLR